MRSSHLPRTLGLLAAMAACTVAYGKTPQPTIPTPLLHAVEITASVKTLPGPEPQQIQELQQEASLVATLSDSAPQGASQWSYMKNVATSLVGAEKKDQFLVLMSGLLENAPTRQHPEQVLKEASRLSMPDAGQALLKDMAMRASLYDKTSLSWSEWIDMGMTHRKQLVQTVWAHAATKVLHKNIDQPCSEPEAVTVTTWNTKCALQTLKGPAAKAPFADKALKNFVFIGTVQASPVFVDTHPAGEFAQAFYMTHPKNPEVRMNGISVSFSLLKQFANDPEVLEFVLMHENGHIEHGHTLNEHTDIPKNEQQADMYAALHFFKKGYSMEQVQQITQRFEAFAESQKNQVGMDTAEFDKMMNARRQAPALAHTFYQQNPVRAVSGLSPR